MLISGLFQANYTTCQSTGLYNGTAAFHLHAERQLWQKNRSPKTNEGVSCQATLTLGHISPIANAFPFSSDLQPNSSLENMLNVVQHGGRQSRIGKRYTHPFSNMTLPAPM